MLSQGCTQTAHRGITGSPVTEHLLSPRGVGEYDTAPGRHLDRVNINVLLSLGPLLDDHNMIYFNGLSRDVILCRWPSGVYATVVVIHAILR